MEGSDLIFIIMAIVIQLIRAAVRSLLLGDVSEQRNGS